MNLRTELFDSSGLPSIAYLFSIAIRTVSMAYGKMYFSEVAFVCELIFGLNYLTGLVYLI